MIYKYSRQLFVEEEKIWSGHGLIKVSLLGVLYLPNIKLMFQIGQLEQLEQVATIHLIIRNRQTNNF